MENLTLDMPSTTWEWKQAWGSSGGPVPRRVGGVLVNQYIQKERVGTLWLKDTIIRPGAFWACTECLRSSGSYMPLEEGTHSWRAEAWPSPPQTKVALGVDVPLPTHCRKTAWYRQGLWKSQGSPHEKDLQVGNIPFPFSSFYQYFLQGLPWLQKTDTTCSTGQHGRKTASFLEKSVKSLSRGLHLQVGW